MTAPSPLWFLDRASGEVTLLLLTAVAVLGILRAARPSMQPFLIEGAHVNLALLAILFAALHVLAAILDPFARLGWFDALIPFASAYRTLWLGLGVVSAYLYVAAVVTSWPARRLSRSAWLWVHRAMYAGWLAAVIHSLGTGSDARNELFIVLDVVAIGAATVAFLALRVTAGLDLHPRLWTVVAFVAVVAVVGTGVWAAFGPLQPGWARASGTPPDLLRQK